MGGKLGGDMVRAIGHIAPPFRLRERLAFSVTVAAAARPRGSACGRLVAMTAAQRGRVASGGRDALLFIAGGYQLARWVRRSTKERANGKPSFFRTTPAQPIGRRMDKASGART